MKQTLIVAIKVALAILLFLCVLKLPYGYYQFVRLFALVGFGALAFESGKESRKFETVVYLFLALLLQPFYKIPLGKEIWNLADVAVGLGLIFSLFFKEIIQSSIPTSNTPDNKPNDTMEKSTKKIIAREVLILLSVIGVGVIFCGAVYLLGAYTSHRYSETDAEYYRIKAKIERHQIWTPPSEDLDIEPAKSSDSLILKEADRQKLLGIVRKMTAAKESEENIRFVIKDFKQKYGHKVRLPKGATLVDVNDLIVGSQKTNLPLPPPYWMRITYDEFGIRIKPLKQLHNILVKEYSDVPKDFDDFKNSMQKPEIQSRIYLIIKKEYPATPDFETFLEILELKPKKSIEKSDTSKLEISQGGDTVDINGASTLLKKRLFTELQRDTSITGKELSLVDVQVTSSIDQLYIKNVYNTVSNKYDLGPIDMFKAKILNAEKRQIFYTEASHYYQLGSYEDFKARLIKSDLILSKAGDAKFYVTWHISPEDVETISIGYLIVVVAVFYILRPLTFLIRWSLKTVKEE